MGGVAACAAPFAAFAPSAFAFVDAAALAAPCPVELAAPGMAIPPVAAEEFCICWFAATKPDDCCCTSVDGAFGSVEMTPDEVTPTPANAGAPMAIAANAAKR